MNSFLPLYIQSFEGFHRLLYSQYLPGREDCTSSFKIEVDVAFCKSTIV